MSRKARMVLVNVVVSLLSAAIIGLLVAFAGGPFWAALGFGLIAYYVVVPMRGGKS